MKKIIDCESLGGIKTALVTGGTGFVGSHLVMHLVRAGWRVHLVSRINSKMPNFSEFELVTNHQYDGTTENMIRIVGIAKPTVVFHLAALVLSDCVESDVDRLVASNILFGSQLLEAMKSNSISNIINTGTFWQHYEGKVYSPVSLYAATKQAFESILQYYVEAYGFRAITLKLYDTYGPDDSRGKILSLLYDAAVSGRTLDMSPGAQLVDLVYIDDVIQSYFLAADRLIKEDGMINEVYAVSSSDPIELKSLVRICSKIFDLTIDVNWGAREYRPREIMIPCSLFPGVPKWHPRISLEEGILRTFSMRKSLTFTSE